jgi:hypothetical protein
MPGSSFNYSALVYRTLHRGYASVRFPARGLISLRIKEIEGALTAGPLRPFRITQPSRCGQYEALIPAAGPGRKNRVEHVKIILKNSSYGKEEACGQSMPSLHIPVEINVP